ncbi:phosphatidylinositol 4,5-bisphosphate-binding protein [Coniothyrium glycines]
MYLAQQSAYQPSDPAVYPEYQQQDYPAASYVNAYPPTQQASSQQAYSQHAYGAEPTYPSQYTPALQSGPTAQTAYTESGDAEPSIIQRHDSNNYGNWMSPAAGGALGGAAAGVLAGEVYRKNQMEQRELAQQQEVDEKQTSQQQLPTQGSDQSNAVEPSVAAIVGAVPNIPARNPDHIAPDMSTAPAIAENAIVPLPVVAVHTIDQTQPTHKPVVPQTASTTDALLKNSEVDGTSARGKTINGGPVPVELVETAEDLAHPGVNRQNTGFSVSDLHVPGEYPKAKMTGPTLSESS